MLALLTDLNHGFVIYSSNDFERPNLDITLNTLIIEFLNQVRVLHQELSKSIPIAAAPPPFVISTIEMISKGRKI